MKLMVCMADTQNFLGRSASCCKVRAPSWSVLLCLSAVPLCSGVYGEVVSCMMPSLLHISVNSFPVYSPLLSVRILFMLAFFWQSNQAIYLLKDSDTVSHSLFLRNSMLVNRVLRSIHVMKYLNPAEDSSNGPHTSETTMSPMSSGRSSV